MTLKKISLQVFISAVLASITSFIYNRIYTEAFEVNFAAILNVGGIIGACLLATLLMGLAYYFGYKWKGEKILGTLNVIISILSFASILGVLGFKLPMDIESPELFPGLAIPMHFFPALSFFAIYPFFKAANTN